MNKVLFKTKFDDCKTLREILDKINNSFFEKTSYKLLTIWILYPLLMMFITYTANNEIARDLMYIVLLIIGVLGIILGIIYSFKKFYKNEKFYIRKYLPLIIGIFLLFWCVLTSYFSINSNISFYGTNYRKEGLQTYFLYSGILLLGILLKNKKLLVKLFNKLIFVEIIISIISLLNNSITYSLMYNQEPYTGIFSQFNHYGYYLMFGILLSIFMFLNNKKIIYLLTYSLLLYTLLLNDTFGCFLSILITLLLIIIYYIFIKKNLKKILPIICIFILICSVTKKDNYNVVQKNFNRFFYDVEVTNDAIKKINKINDKKKRTELLNNLNGIGTSRGTLWKYGIKYIIDHPIIGNGIESTVLLYRYDDINQSRPHNILIQFGIFTGIPGIILYILFIGLILIRNIKIIKVLDDINIFCLFIVICYLISSMFGNSMFYTSPYFFIFLGIISKNTFYKKELT